MGNMFAPRGRGYRPKHYFVREGPWRLRYGWCMIVVLLYHMYHGSLPDDLSPGQVMQVMQLADRLDLPASVKSCSDFFACVQETNISWP